MAVIVIGGEKGGTGKSTTTTNLAIMAAYMGHDIAVVDATTKQSSTFKFFNRRKELKLSPTPSCYRIQGKYLHTELEDLNARYKYVLVDVGGYDSPELRSAMAAPCVHEMYSTFKPAEFDLETAASIDELVYLARSFNPKLCCYAIFNQIAASGGIEEVEKARKVIKSYENLDIANILIYTRKSISMAPGFAKCVVEYEEELRQSLPKYRIKPYLYKSSIEFSELYKIVFKEDFYCKEFKTLYEFKINNNFEEENIRSI